MDVFVGQEYQDESTELAVLGGIILSPEQYHEVVQVGLTGKDFYIANHEVIFNALEDLILSGNPADLVSIEEYLIKNRTSFFNEVLNPSEKGYDDLVKRRITNIRLIMVEAMDAVPVAANTSYYARIVVEKSRMRKVVQAGRNIIGIGLGHKGHENVNDMVSAAHEEVLGLTGYQGNEELAKDSIGTVLDNIKPHSSIPWPWHQVNESLIGMMKGRLYVLGARPSMGKSTVAVELIKSACSERKKVVAFSLEMSKDEVYRRFLASVAEIDISRINRGSLNEAEWERLNAAKEEISKWNLLLSDTHRMSVAQIRATIQRAMKNGNPDLVVLDYLQIARLKHKSKDRRVDVDEIAEECKSLAHDFDVPMVAFAQLNRDAENKKPDIGSLRESGGIENAADVVLLMHRDSRTSNAIEFLIEKNRYGACGYSKHLFDGKFSRVTDFPIDPNQSWQENAYR